MVPAQYDRGAASDASTTTEPAPPQVPPPVAAPGTPPLPPAVPGAAPIPLYRVEMPLYSAIPAMSREMELQTLGTFHERRDEQALLNGQGALPPAWGRFLGGQMEQRWSGTVNPGFDGHFWGLQAGLDLYGIDRQSGHKDRFGVFFGNVRGDGDVKGFAGADVFRRLVGTSAVEQV